MRLPSRNKASTPSDSTSPAEGVDDDRTQWVVAYRGGGHSPGMYTTEEARKRAQDPDVAFVVEDQAEECPHCGSTVTRPPRRFT